MPINPPNPEERFVAIVDDDASVRQSARRLIRALGYRAEAFGPAEEFLHCGEAKSTACLILDMRMPGMNGLELQLRLAGSAIPIVFITGRASEEEERQDGGRSERSCRHSRSEADHPPRPHAKAGNRACEIRCPAAAGAERDRRTADSRVQWRRRKLNAEALL